MRHISFKSSFGILMKMDCSGFLFFTGTIPPEEVNSPGPEVATNAKHGGISPIPFTTDNLTDVIG